jgi:hypothetical protein
MWWFWFWWGDGNLMQVEGDREGGVVALRVPELALALGRVLVLVRAPQKVLQE